MTKTMTFKFITRRPRRVQGVQHIHYTYICMYTTVVIIYFFFFCSTTHSHTHTHGTLWFQKNRLPVVNLVLRDSVLQNAEQRCEREYVYAHTHYLQILHTMAETMCFNENAVAGKFCVSDGCDVCIIIIPMYIVYSYYTCDYSYRRYR